MGLALLDFLAIVVGCLTVIAVAGMWFGRKRDDDE